MNFVDIENRLMSGYKESVIIKQKLLKDNVNFINKLSVSIKEELNGSALDDFIIKFVNEIIVSKIDNDRYNLKLDIYLNIFGEEKNRIKKARHIGSINSNVVSYLINQKCLSIESLRKDRKTNIFVYNVYIETL